MFLTSLVKVAPCFELTGRPDVSRLELRIDLTLGRRPDDVEVFRLILFVIEVKDVTQMGWVKLWEYIEAHDFTAYIGEYFGDASGAFKKFQDTHTIIPDGFIFGSWGQWGCYFTMSMTSPNHPKHVPTSRPYCP